MLGNTTDTMWVRRHPVRSALTVDLLWMVSLALSLLPSSSVASTYDCKQIRIDGKSFDLSALSGPHSIWHTTPHPPRTINTTYTLDICRPLQRTKGVPKKDECPGLTRVCGIQRLAMEGHEGENEGNSDDGKALSIIGVIPIAGDFLHDGKPLDAQWTQIKSSSSKSDTAKDGIRVELHGGQFPFDEKDGRKQRAVIEFLCDRDRTGLEGLAGADADGGKSSDKKNSERRRENKETKEGDDGGDDKDAPKDGSGDEGSGKGDKADDKKSLKFIHYGPTSGDAQEDTLQLQWRTNHACEGVRGDNDKGGGSKSKSSHWGFFTWFIIM